MSLGSIYWKNRIFGYIFMKITATVRLFLPEVGLGIYIYIWLIVKVDMWRAFLFGSEFDIHLCGKKLSFRFELHNIWNLENALPIFISYVSTQLFVNFTQKFYKCRRNKNPIHM